MPSTPRKPGSFPPGHQGPRRVRGVPNRYTRELRAAIIDAAISHGSDGCGRGGLVGYGYFLASRHPKAFCHLLGKLLPLQIDGHLAGTVAKINIVSVPMNSYLGADDVARSLPSLQLDGVNGPTEPGHSLGNDVTQADS